MSVVVVTGSSARIGFDMVAFFDAKGVGIVDLDNDTRARPFGSWRRRRAD
jgi:hypothetical protein